MHPVSGFGAGTNRALTRYWAGIMLLLDSLVQSHTPGLSTL